MTIEPRDVHSTLGRYMLVDGFDLVLDLRKSKGCRLYDSKQEKSYLDGFSFFASAPLGINHPALDNPEFIKRLGTVSVNKPTNSDLYTTEMAEFVDAFATYAVSDHFKHLFFVDGGALAIENGLKTAFDWKIRKNLEHADGELGTQVIHFKEAFHGRSGYTLSMTNTFNLDKVRYFPKFKWPRIINPKLTFPLNDENLSEVIETEKQAISQIKTALENNPDDIAALIIEPIQGEGGDNHFRKEFFFKLRHLCDEYDMMFMVDEVQSGLGLTGKMWAIDNYDVKPDILAFGKKTQVCGIMVNDRVDDIKDNVFNVPSRLNSTWGGNLVDMVRVQRYLEVIYEDDLLKNATVQGKNLRKGLEEIQEKYPEIISNARGLGLMCAFDLPTPKQRDQFKNRLYKNGLMVLGCGSATIRFRPALIITEEEINEMLSIIEKTLEEW
ncbi:MAG: L-lysine 6-transaminase [Candidatus Thermoplasmatota archaeon]|nr:L-lysine 6-transaminase [Candidatus Thermoplasmatota archaeon]